MGEDHAVSRRRFVESVGLTGLAGLAGCTEGSPENTETAVSTGSADRTDGETETQNSPPTGEEIQRTLEGEAENLSMGGSWRNASNSIISWEPAGEVYAYESSPSTIQELLDFPPLIGMRHVDVAGSLSHMDQTRAREFRNNYDNILLSAINQNSIFNSDILVTDLDRFYTVNAGDFVVADVRTDAQNVNELIKSAAPNSTTGRYVNGTVNADFNGEEQNIVVKSPAESSRVVAATEAEGPPPLGKGDHDYQFGGTLKQSDSGTEYANRWTDATLQSLSGQTQSAVDQSDILSAIYKTASEDLKNVVAINVRHDKRTDGEIKAEGSYDTLEDGELKKRGFDVYSDGSVEFRAAAEQEPVIEHT